jgi:hypothetical protein
MVSRAILLVAAPFHQSTSSWFNASNTNSRTYDDGTFRQQQQTHYNHDKILQCRQPVSYNQYLGYSASAYSRPEAVVLWSFQGLRMCREWPFSDKVNQFVSKVQSEIHINHVISITTFFWYRPHKVRTWKEFMKLCASSCENILHLTIQRLSVYHTHFKYLSVCSHPLG